MDVLLINLPTDRWYKKTLAKKSSMPPVGLLYLATVLHNNNYKVKVIDFAIESILKDQFRELLDQNKPKIIAMSTYNESWQALKIFTKITKSILPECKIVAGGAFATFCFTDIFAETQIDYVIRGEGDYAMLKLCNIIFKRVNENIETISGIVYRKKNNELYINNSIERISDLDQLPFIKRDLIDLKKYTIPFTISTARGCPGDCIFCSSRAFWGKKVYIRSARNIFQEIMHIYKKYKSKQFYIADDTFTASPRRVEEFCKLILESKIDFDWSCESRANVVTDELCKRIVDAGCGKVQIGLESADNEILQKLKKRVTIEQIENAVKLLYKYKLNIVVSFIIGNAHDTHETMKKTLDFARHLKIDYNAFTVCSINTPFPGTEQYARAEEFKLKIYSENWSDYCLNNAIISTPYLTKEEIQDYYLKGLSLKV